MRSTTTPSDHGLFPFLILVATITLPLLARSETTKPRRRSAPSHQSWTPFHPQSWVWGTQFDACRRASHPKIISARLDRTQFNWRMTCEDSIYSPKDTIAIKYEASPSFLQYSDGATSIAIGSYLQQSPNFGHANVYSAAVRAHLLHSAPSRD